MLSHFLNFIFLSERKTLTSFSPLPPPFRPLPPPRATSNNHQGEFWVERLGEGELDRDRAEGRDRRRVRRKKKKLPRTSFRMGARRTALHPSKLPPLCGSGPSVDLASPSPVARSALRDQNLVCRARRSTSVSATQEGCRRRFVAALLACTRVGAATGGASLVSPFALAGVQ